MGGSIYILFGKADTCKPECAYIMLGIYLWIYDNVTPDQIKIKFNERWVSNFSKLKLWLWQWQNVRRYYYAGEDGKEVAWLCSRGKGN